MKSFEFPNCNEVVFSYQGHLLACTYDNLITIFSVFPFQVQRTLVVTIRPPLNLPRMYIELDGIAFNSICFERVTAAKC